MTSLLRVRSTRCQAAPASTTEQAATCQCPIVLHIRVLSACGDDLVRCRREASCSFAALPGAVDIEVDWTVEAANDIDAVQVDPYWTSRVNALAVIGYSTAAGPCSSCSPTATTTATYTA